MADGKISKENRQGLKAEIESLLSTISAEPNEEMRIDNELSMETMSESQHDFDQISEDFNDKAREMTDALFKNYVDIGIFENSDWARIKKETDTVNISNLFFQLKTIKITIIKVMEEISAGNTHPRLLEVMGQLQDKMASITKMQANYVLFLEDTYKKLNEEIPANPDDVDVNSNPNEGQFFVSIGTKDVIENLPEVDVTDDDIAPDENDLVDPSNKNELIKDAADDIEFEDEDGLDDFIDLEEII